MTRLWGPPGRLLSTPDVNFPPQLKPSLVSDGDGGAIFVWQSVTDSGDQNIRAQRISDTGSVLWNIALCAEASPQLSPDICSDGAGGWIAAWQDRRLDPNGDIYAQRVDRSGSALWTLDGVPLVTGSSSNSGGDYTIRMAADSRGGAFLAFADDRDAAGVSDPGTSKVWAQHVTQTGAAVWGNGVPAGAGPGSHVNHNLVYDGEDGAVVAWEDRSVPGNAAISAQRLKPNGSVFWQSGGINITKAAGDQTAPSLVTDNRGSLIVAWADARSGGSDVYSEHLCLSTKGFTAVETTPSPVTRAVLGAPTPNPSGGAFEYTLRLSKGSRVRVFVTDVQGRLVESLTDRRLPAGTHSFAWDPSRSGKQIAAGVYFLRVEADDARAARKIVLIR